MIAPFEKTGNTCWARCPDCDAWFPVTATLLQMQTVKLVCPECHRNFLPEEAQSLVGND